MSSLHSSNESDAEDEPRCVYCRLPWIFVDSKFHLGRPAETEGGKIYTIDVSHAGFPGDCNFCKLFVDVQAILKHDWRRNKVGALIAFWDAGFELSFYIWLVDEATGDVDHRNYTEVSVFIEKGSDSEWHLRRLRHPSGDTSSAQAVTTIRSWLDTCKNEHEACRGRTHPRSMPARILKVDRDHVQLCESTTLPQPYACLSHCWGVTGPKVKLSANNIDHMRAGVSVEQVPKTFRDAIKVCLDIGIHYLWIDALCILQDDLGDWHTTAASMADIYAGAMLTLAATRADDSEQGCFTQMQEKHRALLLQGSGLYVRRATRKFPRKHGWYEDKFRDDWPLLTRAWVFQERKLSARVLHFGKEQLYWECDSAVLSEDGAEDYTKLESGNFRSNQEDPEEAWRKTVTHYSSLELTCTTDRLPAISAVVKRMQARRVGDVYVAGMWQNTLLEDLSWCTEDYLKSRPEGNLPTWSWISTLGEVYWRTSTRALESAALVRTDFKIIGPSHFGFAKNPTVTVKGPASSLQVASNTSWLILNNLKILELPSEYEHIQSVCYAFRDYDWTAEHFGVRSDDVLAFVLLWDVCDGETIQGLLLRNTADGRYQRVGLIRLDKYLLRGEIPSADFLDSYVASLPIKEFTIV